MAESTPFIESTRYTSFAGNASHAYIFPVLQRLCDELRPNSRVLDIGCGNGSLASEFVKRGHSVVGIDLAEPGVRLARTRCPAGRFEVLSASKNLLEALQEPPFDLVYSVEVIEHLYDPRSFMAGCYAATKAQGRFLCTTPYHGYFKNLAIALAGKWDQHHNPDCDGGHIQFFSRKTLSALMFETGFRELRFEGVGRYPYLWKSMAIACTRP